LALLHWVLLQSGRKRREDCLLRKAIEIFDDKVPEAIVEHLAMLVHYQLVANLVAFVEGEFVCILMLDFTNVQGEPRPGFVSGETRELVN